LKILISKIYFKEISIHLRFDINELNTRCACSSVDRA